MNENTDVEAANLSNAILDEARMVNCDLSGVSLLGASLNGTGLSGADLRQARFLTSDQLDQARGSHRTQLPEGTKLKLRRSPIYNAKGKIVGWEEGGTIGEEVGRKYQDPPPKLETDWLEQEFNDEVVEPDYQDGKD